MKMWNDDISNEYDNTNTGETKDRIKSAPSRSIGRMVKSAHGYEMLEQFKKNDRLVFPGEPKRQSVTSFLVELSKPVKKRPKTAAKLDRNAADFDTTTVNLKHKVSRDEMDNIVARLNRPTHMSNSRTTSAWEKRKTNTKKTENPKRNENAIPVNYLTDVVNPNRFQGNRKVSKKQISDIVNRLTQGPKRTTHVQPRTKQEKEIGLLNSYRWKGIQNC